MLVNAAGVQRLLGTLLIWSLAGLLGWQPLEATLAYLLNSRREEHNTSPSTICAGVLCSPIFLKVTSKVN